LSEDQEFSFPAEPPELATAIGRQEEILREALGNDRYETMIKFGDEVGEANLATDRAVAHRLEAVATTYETVTASIPVILLLGIGWSIARWVTWARR